MNTLADYQPGDVLFITTRTRDGEETRCAEVTLINHNDSRGVTYIGHYLMKPANMQATGSGFFVPEQIGKFPFGVVKVRKIGRTRPVYAPRWTPAPGDKAYDSVH